MTAHPPIPPNRPTARPQVRDFMLHKIYQLKRPKTNVQIIQQSVLLKYKYFVRFLRQHGTEVYNEVRLVGGWLAAGCVSSRALGGGHPSRNSTLTPQTHPACVFLCV